MNWITRKYKLVTIVGIFTSIFFAFHFANSDSREEQGFDFIAPAVSDTSDAPSQVGSIVIDTSGNNFWGRVNNAWIKLTNDPTVEVPTGTLLAFAGSTAPAGYLLAYGQAVSRTTYATLFALVGTTYGSGDGSTTFNLPDLRGRTAVGKDDMGGSAANRITSAGSGINGTTLGATGGTETHTLTLGQIPSHNHTLSLAPSGFDNSDNPISGSGASPNRTGTTTSAGGGGAHLNTQPSLIANYIIKY
jgi:microcystin-dependent protein